MCACAWICLHLTSAVILIVHPSPCFVFLRMDVCPRAAPVHSSPPLLKTTTTAPQPGSRNPAPPPMPPACTSATPRRTPPRGPPSAAWSAAHPSQGPSGPTLVTVRPFPVTAPPHTPLNTKYETPQHFQPRDGNPARSPARSTAKTSWSGRKVRFCPVYAMNTSPWTVTFRFRQCLQLAWIAP